MATRSEQAKARVKVINRSHESAHHACHAVFRKAYAAAMARHGLKMGVVKNGPSLMDHFSFPIEFHEDEELNEARKALHAGLALAEDAKRSNAASLPRLRRR